MRDGGFGRVEGSERLVVYPDQICGCGRSFLARRRHGCDGIADEADFVDAKGMLVLRDGENPERNRQVGTREHGLHAVQLLRPRDIDRHDARVGLGAAQQLAVQHAGEGEIVGESRGARHFRNGVNFPHRSADDAMLIGHTVILAWVPPSHRASVPQPAPPPHRS